MNFLGRIRRNHAAALCGAALLLAPPGAVAAAFKCVAADGTVEYRELADKAMTCTALRTAPAPSVDPAAKMQELKDRVEQIDAARADGDDDVRVKNCRQARSNAEVLRGDKSVIQKNADGDEEILGKEQRAAALKQTEKDIDYWCN